VIRGALIGARFKHCSLDTYEVTNFNREAHAACWRLARGESEGVLLMGPVGVGKTHLLIGLLRAFEDRGRPDEAAEDLVEVPNLRELIDEAQSESSDDAQVLLDPDEGSPDPWIEFWPMLDLVSELRAEIKAGELELSRRCRLCDLLVIDDLGAERGSDFVQEELRRIVDWRYRDRLPIAIATNLTVEGLHAKYGAAAISRWTESCELVRAEGPDHRASR